MFRPEHLCMELLLNAPDRNVRLGWRPSYKHYLEAHARQGGALILEICHFCPVACDHCHISSDAHSKLVLSDETISKSIRAFARYPDAEYVFCTGGEPYSFPKKLALALNTINSEGLIGYTLTSGNWATTVQAAVRMLDSLPPIKLFAVSIDDYHAKKIGMERPVNAARAAVDKGISTFVCIGHLGLNDPFRQRALDALGEELVNQVEIIYYPLLARGSGANLPELQGRELSRSASAPCFSIGAPLITANGAFVACCHTTQANRVRNGQPTPLNFGSGGELDEAMSAYMGDSFGTAMRTIGPAQIAAVSGIEVPDGFASWDICQACEYLHAPQRYQVITERLNASAVNPARLRLLDAVLSGRSAERLGSFLQAGAING
jgi:hypothetical protein